MSLARAIKALVTGMKTTLLEAFRPTETRSYPEEKTPYSTRWRGLHGLFFKEGTTEELCVSCHLCAKICPSRCITMEGEELPDGRKILYRFDIDLGRCIYCGYCEEACPVDAIRLTASHDYIVTDREDFVLHKDELLEIGTIFTERGGEEPWT